MSYVPDPDAYAVNALSFIWTNINAFVFPPFSVLGLVLQKILADQATVIVGGTNIQPQPWFPTLLKLASHQPFLLLRR